MVHSSLVPSPSHPSLCLAEAGVGRTGNAASSQCILQQLDTVLSLLSTYKSQLLSISCFKP